jgi:molybdopterin molybdotransferase
MKTIQEALTLILEQVHQLDSEVVGIQEAYHRILAEDITADRDYPPFNRATMDGFALNISDWNQRNIRQFKLIEELHAGIVPKQKMGKGDCLKIMTGAAVPPEADAIIKVELSKQEGSMISFDENGNLEKWRNIALQGEDKNEGEILAKKGQVCNAAIISILAVTGKTQIKVARLPKVSIISTGTEVLPPDGPILPHQIRDSNSYALQSMLKKYNIELQHKLLIPDNKPQLMEAVAKGLQSDVLILSGGVSMGDADFVPEVLLSHGVHNIFHKIKIKPGKPLWFGKKENGPIVFGLPGNPMSCQVGFRVFVEPYLRAIIGLPEPQVLYLPLILGHHKRSNFDEYFPCKLVNKDGRTFLKTNTYNTSGDIAAMIGSDGLAIHSAESTTLQENTIVAFLPW